MTKVKKRINLEWYKIKAGRDAYSNPQNSIWKFRRLKAYCTLIHPRKRSEWSAWSWESEIVGCLWGSIGSWTWHKTTRKRDVLWRYRLCSFNDAKNWQRTTQNQQERPQGGHSIYQSCSLHIDSVLPLSIREYKEQNRFHKNYFDEMLPIKFIIFHFLILYSIIFSAPINSMQQPSQSLQPLHPNSQSTRSIQRTRKTQWMRKTQWIRKTQRIWKSQGNQNQECNVS